LQQSLDYLVMGYHYYRFTRDTVVPEYDRVLANIPEDQKPRRAETAKPKPELAPPASGLVEITMG